MAEIRSYNFSLQKKNNVTVLSKSFANEKVRLTFKKPESDGVLDVELSMEEFGTIVADFLGANDLANSLNEMLNKDQEAEKGNEDPQY
jgi:hypothetical protein